MSAVFFFYLVKLIIIIYLKGLAKEQKNPNEAQNSKNFNVDVQAMDLFISTQDCLAPIICINKHLFQQNKSETNKVE